MKRLLAILAAGLAVCGLAMYKLIERSLLPTGKFILPVGASTDVGSFPINMALSPDGRFIVVTDTGERQALTVLDAKTGDATFSLPIDDKDGLYYGLAFGKEGELYVSHGDTNTISVHRITPEGKLEQYASPIKVPRGPEGTPHYLAGLAVSDDGKTLYAVENESYSKTQFKGAVAVIDLQSKSVVRTIDTPGFPFAIACAGSKLYVSSEMEDCVAVLDAKHNEILKTIRVGTRPVGIALNKGRDTLYVANANGDSLYSIDTKRDAVKKRLFLRAPYVRGLPGCTPLGVALSSDEKRLFVPMADWNAVAIVDAAKWKVTGYVPTGWYPTSAVVANGRLFVSNGRGSQSRNPNPADVNNHGHYILSIMEGTVSRVSLEDVDKAQQYLTDQVLANNRVAELRQAPAFHNPGIDHVIYVIKENRTYDQILGDVAEGNGDPTLCLFGKDVTPNQHALARRFGLYDNFFVCAEVSADGWNWSTAGMANEYTSRNTVTNYGGRGRDYDFEGTTNGEPVELIGRNDVAKPQGGFIWDQCRKKGVSYRNYGFFNIDHEAEGKDGDGNAVLKKNEPVKRALLGRTCLDFYQYDTAYADSNAWIKLGIPAAPKQMKAYGSKKDPSRFDVWKREYDEFLRNGKMPKFMMVRFMRDHTAGTAAGLNSPKAMVADNDYAVGALVDTVTHGPLWGRTAIFVVEDDAQSGQDHIDAHRSVVQVISAYSAGGPNHVFYNTDSVLRTMELLLGLPPMCQYDAVATPFQFSRDPVTTGPYNAVLPARDLLAQVNSKTAYRSADSNRLVRRNGEDDAADLALNDILWHSIKGVGAEMPETPGLRVR